MASRPYPIANIRTGLERDIEPELLSNDAFPNLEDCFMFRGRVERRHGYNSLGRLVSAVSGEAVGTVTTPWTSFSGTLANAPISPGSVRITVGAVTFTDVNTPFGSQTGVLVGTPGTNSGTVNYITGAITLSFSPALGGDTNVVAAYDFYNDLPVMGLPSRELTAINQEQLIAFDTIKANAFSNSSNSFVDISFHKTTLNPFSWTGSNSNFFWGFNYANAFWATNGTRGYQAVVDATNPALGDGLRWYDGTGWINFLPPVDGTNFLMGALMMFSYRGRIVTLNTFEGSGYNTFTNFAQRARWSQNGTPYYVVPVPTGYTGGVNINAWRSDVVGRGGFIDAPTQEQIITAQFFKDTLIVFFERSTWQLRYTGNETLPFIWERVNVDLGAESTFSAVPFDGGVIAVGNYGIVICDATGVKRIDQIIPDEVFNIHNGNDGVKRVHGIRDYTKQLVYWTFPDEDKNPIFPNRVLVYNYLDESYSFFNDSFTCFGTFEPFNDATWATLTIPWENYPFGWNSGQFQSGYPIIVAGNQEGFVFRDINNGPTINSAPSLFITNITSASVGVVTSPNHNLQTGQIIVISDVAGMTQLNGLIFRVSNPTQNTFEIQHLVGDIWINEDTTSFTAYTSGGLITVRNSINILTKRFNPFLDIGAQLRVNYIDFLVEATQTGQFTLNIYIDENDNTAVETLLVDTDNNSGQGKVWCRIYPNTIAQYVQLEITYSDEQINNPDQSNPNLVLYSLMPWFSQAGRLIYGSAL